jgi:hypothetical protein
VATHSIESARPRTTKRLTAAKNCGTLESERGRECLRAACLQWFNAFGVFLDQPSNDITTEYRILAFVAGIAKKNLWIEKNRVRRSPDRRWR